ncbi:hypothetical protein MW887_002168 [Aspergillus wentii]|nr:hypothetical protein MW887_002168 [Aspergillus wentii]
MAAVNRNMFDASIMTDRPHEGSLMVLPLNIIALIISHMDDTGDLARLCSTCRVLNYMALPQLYRNLTLTSYDKIRYRGDEPEGMGSASPFSLGLSAVITRPYATLVRSLTLRGDWREHELEEHARVGRVPDSSMMLNIAVRAAVDRMTELRTFNWELNTKMLETVYLGLAQLPKLTSLTVRFPSSRHPRPTIVIPALPHLRHLRLTDMDPLCYPDDISTLLWKSKKLRELTMHWSPRMRNAQEPSVMLNHYFRKCIAAKQPLPIKKLSLLNLYAFHSEEFNLAFDPRTIEDVTILNDTPLENGNLMNTFVDNSWPTYPPNMDMKIKAIRQNASSKRHAEFLGNFSGLERLYFVNVPQDPINSLAPSKHPAGAPLSATLTPPQDHTHFASNGTATNSPSPSPIGGSSGIQDFYLNNIMSNHCATLRHLLLPSRWPLSPSTIARLVRVSPQLEQLAFAAELSSMDTLGLMLPFLHNLAAIRILIPTGRPSIPLGNGAAPQPAKCSMATAKTLADMVELDDEILTEGMSLALGDKEIYSKLKIVGFGRKAWELGRFYSAPAPPRIEHPSSSQSPAAASTVDTVELNEYNQSPKSDTTPGRGPLSNPQFEVNGAPSTGSTTPTGPPRRPTQRAIQPPSVLGKRPREDERWPPMPAKHIPPYDSLVTGEDNFYCPPPVVGLDGRVIRRELRRVGWEVLQHWEIWGLDTQEA